MLRQFNRFIILAVIVGVALYITLTNSDSATIKLGPSLTITTYAGVIYIGVFVVGCIVASLVALFFGFKGYLRERKLRSVERATKNFFKTFERARDLMAAEDWAAARLVWEDVIARDPDNVVARVELSRCVESLGDQREALRVLDATRASSRSSAEVLYRAAILNRSVGNNTAARDNVGILLSEAPSRHALEIARDASEAMGKFDDALGYHEELERIGYQGPESEEIGARLSYSRVLQQTTHGSALKDELLAFVKRYPQHVPALERLAEIEKGNRELDRAADLLVKAARASGNSLVKWRAVVSLWLEHGPAEAAKRVDRAIAAAKNAAKDQRGRARLEAELLIIQTLLAVNHFQDAERLLDGFQDLARREVGEVPVDLARDLVIQRGYALSQMGNARETTALWQQLASPNAQSDRTAASSRGASANAAGPSPTFSTP